MVNYCGFRVFSFFTENLKCWKFLGFYLVYTLLLYSLKFPCRSEGSRRPSREGKTFETWELLCFCALNLLELFRTKNRIAPPAQFLVINKVVFFSDNQDFQTIIYRAKPFFFSKNFVDLVTVNQFMVFNILPVKGLW